jgi:NTP pyrophosphatase (non-canonical NTP hydrolase)
MQNIIELIREANPSRSFSDTKRRLLKIGEEKGEVCEAILNVTSSHNKKNKTWDDVREELADCFIVAVDIALTFDANMNFDLYIRHIDRYDESKFIDKMLITGHLLSSLGYNIDCNVSPPDEKIDGDIQDGNCISKTLAKLFFELAVLIFPDKENSTEEQLIEAFSNEVVRKISKWTSKK